ncbi:Protein of unknown function [Gryllus bimaculatus]|nr:Protein of unknown function [Gryllus bimaculatus]
MQSTFIRIMTITDFLYN